LITATMSSLYELERENILERTAMGKKIYVMNGGKLGRKIGSVESRDTFLKKEQTQKIISLLEKGKSVRDISSRLGTSFRTITKVRKMIGIQKMDKKQGEKFVKGLKNQPIVSSSEFAELMMD